MDRRLFVGSLAVGILTVPRVAPAQPVRRMYRIGILGSSAPTSEMVGPQHRNPTVGALLRGLHQLGYVYGEHFVTEPRGAEDRPERFPGLAAEMVRLQVDVIVAGGVLLAALKAATSTIPIVMGGASDPVGEGLVRSLGHPGGNFTGLSLQSVETTEKRLELLKELVPGVAPVAVIWSRLNPRSWQAAEVAARKRGWKLLSLEIRHAGELEGVFKAATAARAGAVLAPAPGLIFGQARRVGELAARSRLPEMHAIRPYVRRVGRQASRPSRSCRTKTAARRAVHPPPNRGKSTMNVKESEWALA
jgi:putative ABC transport system substrate-binding protein